MFLKVVGNLKFLSILQRNIPKTMLSYCILMKKMFTEFMVMTDISNTFFSCGPSQDIVETVATFLLDYFNFQ